MNLELKMRTKPVIALLLLWAVTILLPAYGQKPKLPESATVQISIEDCLESEDIAIPINKSYLTSGKFVSGGGRSRACGSYSYAMHAMKRGRSRVSIHLTVSVNSANIEKELVLTRGKKNEYQLGQGIKVVASY